MDVINNISSLFASQGPPVKGVTQAEVDAFIRINTNPTNGPELWNMFNAIAVLVLIIALLFGIMAAMQQMEDYQKVRDNWKDYRCQPLIMPFASAYGYNTAENFEFCLKNIFTGYAEEITAPFSSVLATFTKILTTISGTVNSVKESVATMGGGIMTIFQDFTDRIMNFFFQLRLSAIRIKNMIYRMQAIMYSVIYMGISTIKAGQNFSNTFLFSFLDTFCFPPETTISVKGKGLIPIYQVQIGDILVPTNSRVTAKFHFAAQGQPMVVLKDGIQVSTNHYIEHKSRWIPAADHPDARPIGPYERQSLICLNTEDHVIPMGPYHFRDYDETAAGDLATMRMIEGRLNGVDSEKLATPEPYSSITENSPTFHPDTYIKLYNGSLCKVKDLQVTMRLSTGSWIGGLFHKEIQEVCQITDTDIVGSATLVWDASKHQWIRAGTQRPCLHYKRPVIFIGIIALTGSQIELASGLRVRDYLELCSPDAEQFYSEHLEASVVDPVA
jgi:hypothetical protein